MIIAFLHAQQDDECALLMLESVQRIMRKVPCVQLTCRDTPALPNCAVRRLPWDMASPVRFRLQHLSELDGEIIVLDTDVIVQRDLRPVFWFPFDVALTRRDGPIYQPDGVDVVKTMPYNLGVAFSRGPQFWRDCLRCFDAQYADRPWYGDQLAAATVAPLFKVLKLHCDNFNHTPGHAAEDVGERYAVHYKGKRKAWMRERWGHKETVSVAG